MQVDNAVVFTYVISNDVWSWFTEVWSKQVKLQPLTLILEMLSSLKRWDWRLLLIDNCIWVMYNMIFNVGPTSVKMIVIA